MATDTRPPFAARRSERDAARREPPAAAPEAQRPTRRHARLLLVEDEDAFRELLQVYLESEGFTVHAVRDAHDGVSWLGLNPVDVIITDLCMPKSDGIELLMSLKQLRSTIPIIVMSGGVRGEMAGMLRAAMLLGAKRTLAKPFPLQLLATAVRDALPPNR